MDLKDAIAARRSVRAFLPDPVPLDRLVGIARDAARAASGGNLQPWHVDIVHGAPMARLKALMAERLAAGALERMEYAVYPPALAAPYRDRRFAVGEAMYAELGIARADKSARREWFARNYAFFGAPAACFVTVDRGMGPPQWADLGMYLQALMLLAVEAGLATCAQEAWAVYPNTIDAFIGTPATRMLFCGVAIGREDQDAPVNRLRSERAPPDEWLRVVD
jgi:nitroreductase